MARITGLLAVDFEAVLDFAWVMDLSPVTGLGLLIDLHFATDPGAVTVLELVNLEAETVLESVEDFGLADALVGSS